MFLFYQTNAALVSRDLTDHNMF